MSVHSFIPGTEAYILLILSSVICVTGLIVLFRQWGQGSLYRFLSAWRREAFRYGTLSFGKILILDVLLFRRIWRRSVYRWVGHMSIFWSFLFLGGFILISLAGIFLSFVDPEGYGGNFAESLSGLHLPYDLLGYFILASVLFALVRRLVVRKVRDRTVIPDFFMISSVLIIALTGMVAEWYSGYSTFFGKTLLNWDAALLVLRWHLYVVFLLFIMVIPWTRFKHIITVPLLLLARRGGE